jgi:hypothetical protein
LLKFLHRGTPPTADMILQAENQVRREIPKTSSSLSNAVNEGMGMMGEFGRRMKSGGEEGVKNFKAYTGMEADEVEEQPREEGRRRREPVMDDNSARRRAEARRDERPERGERHVREERERRGDWERERRSPARRAGSPQRKAVSPQRRAASPQRRPRDGSGRSPTRTGDRMRPADGRSPSRPEQSVRAPAARYDDGRGQSGRAPAARYDEGRGPRIDQGRDDTRDRRRPEEPRRREEPPRHRVRHDELDGSMSGLNVESKEMKSGKEKGKGGWFSRK